jgi:hypothetical protein
MNIKVGKIYGFKLNSGEEVIAKVDSISDNIVRITKPLSLAFGQQGPSLMPSMVSADTSKSVNLNLDVCSLVARVGSDVEDHYLRGISELDLPPAKQIITE